MDKLTLQAQNDIMTEVVSVADAKRRFSELIERVGRGERFVVTRRGKPVLALVSPSAAAEEPDHAGKRGFMALWGALEGIEGAEGWYEDVQAIVADRANHMPRAMSYFDDP
jgi:prevent-host-death family protein